LCARVANHNAAVGRSSSPLGAIIFRAFAICALALAASSCAIHDEVARVSSSDGTVDAIAIRGDGGGTVTFWYEIYVAERGAGYSSGHLVASLTGPLLNAQDFGVNLKWAGPNDLYVEYYSTRKAKVDSSTVQVGAKRINVSLHPGVTSTS
jgi:hypothetical protein